MYMVSFREKPKNLSLHFRAMSYRYIGGGNNHGQGQGSEPSTRKRRTSSEGQRLVDTMQAKGLLSNDDTDETALEAALPPYGSDEEAALFEELASELGKAFGAAGTTIADEVRAERDE